MFTHKVFIIGLPRTATTSVCLALLESGFKTAHTAYTTNTLEHAQVIADTPVFADYPLLDKKYPGSKFVYLERDINSWVPSIKQLLKRMYVNLQRSDGGFNPHLKRCYNQVFSPLSQESILSDDFLKGCFERHHNDVIQYFSNRQQDLLSINVSDDDSYQRLMNFLKVPPQSQHQKGFKRINMAGKVTAWNDIKHKDKIPSTNQGKIDKTL